MHCPMGATPDSESLNYNTNHDVRYWSNESRSQSKLECQYTAYSCMYLVGPSRKLIVSGNPSHGQSSQVIHLLIESSTFLVA